MGHDHAPAPAASDEPIPGHVKTISRITTRLGQFLGALGLLSAVPLGFTKGALWLCVALFVSLYGACIYLAGRDVIAATD